MATTRVKIDGLRQLGEAMRGLSEDINKRIARSATGAAAQVVKKAAIANVIGNPSVDTGSLRDAIISKRLGKSETDLTSEHIVTVRKRKTGSVKARAKQKTAPHASYVEFGTIKMPAEPFLRPAFDSSKEKALQAMQDRLAARIAKAQKG